MSARLGMVEQTANLLLRMSADPTILSSKVELQWAKRWLDRQSDLFKVKRKLLAAAKKNAHNPDLLIDYFRKYKEIIDRYGIQPAYQ